MYILLYYAREEGRGVMTSLIICIAFYVCNILIGGGGGGGRGGSSIFRVLDS